MISLQAFCVTALTRDVVGKHTSVLLFPQTSARQAKRPGFVRETAKSEMGTSRNQITSALP